MAASNIQVFGLVIGFGEYSKTEVLVIVIEHLHVKVWKYWKAAYIDVLGH